MNILIITFMFIQLSLAAHMDLPRGGQLKFDERSWTVLENKVVDGIKTLIISNKKDKELNGYILDGTIKGQHKCESKEISKWVTCLEILPMAKEVSYQIYLQRNLGKDIFQIYVLSFNFSQDKLDRYKIQLEDLEKYLRSP